MLVSKMEAIAYQKTSTLHLDLSDIFQMVIDYRNELYESSDGDHYLDARKDLADSVLHYAKRVMVPKFIDVVKKHTGLTVAKMKLFGGDSDITCAFAVDLSFQDTRSAMNIMSRSTGTLNTATSRKAYLAEMAAMAKGFDRETGKITNVNRPLLGAPSVTIFFDVNAAFLPKAFLPVKEIEYLSAKEIAAIMMHEIGHALSVIEHSGDQFHIMNRMRDYINDLHKNGVVAQDLVDIQDTLTPIIEANLTNENLSKETKDRLSMLVAGMKKTTKLATSAPLEESWAVTIGSLIFNLLMMASIIYVMLYMLFLQELITGSIVYEIRRCLYSQQQSNGDKSSDTRTNYNNIFLIERWADEYVARHGMSNFLASGLRKILKYGEFMQIGSISSYRLRHSTLFYCVCKLFNVFLDIVHPAKYRDPLGYENNFNRIRRMHQDMKGFFKDQYVDPEIRDQWYRNMKDVEKEMAKMKKVSDTEFAKAIYNTLKNMSNPARWFILLRDGNLDRDTEIIANRIDDLSNNKLFAQSSKISSIPGVSYE